MPSSTPTPPRSFEDRRAFYRINVTLPICLQAETDTTEGEFVDKSVNLSGGGIGVTVNVPYNPNEVLSLTLYLPGGVVFKAYIEVLRVDPIAYPPNTYRLHARFVRITNQNRELVIRYIMRFQREHLQKHYMA